MPERRSSPKRQTLASPPKYPSERQLLIKYNNESIDNNPHLVEKKNKIRIGK